MALDKDAIDKTLEEATGTLSIDQKTDIWIQANQIINDGLEQLNQWAETNFGDPARREVENFVTIVEDLATSVDFTNPNNPGVLAAKDKEPVWIYLQKQIDKVNANGGQIPTTDPPPPPFDFCLGSLAQVLAVKGVNLGSQFLSGLKAAVCAPEGGLVDLIDSNVPGFKDWYKDADKLRKDQINAALKDIAAARLEREALFKEVQVWKNWDTLLGQKINEFKSNTKEDLTEWLSGTDVKNDPNYQLYAGLVNGAAEVLERCYANNPSFKDLKKVIGDTGDVIKAYTDGIYVQISNLNNFIAKAEVFLEDVLIDVRDADPCKIVEDGIGALQSCYDCYANYLKWKTDDTGKLSPPVCTVPNCGSTIDLNGNVTQPPGWISNPPK